MSSVDSTFCANKNYLPPFVTKSWREKFPSDVFVPYFHRFSLDFCPELNHLSITGGLKQQDKSLPSSGRYRSPSPWQVHGRTHKLGQDNDGQRTIDDDCPRAHGKHRVLDTATNGVVANCWKQLALAAMRLLADWPPMRHEPM